MTLKLILFVYIRYIQTLGTIRKMKTTKIELWRILEHKFCVNLKNAFSNKDVKGWLNHFAPNKKINVYQHGNRKITKIYTGNLLNSMLNGRIPAKVMATIFFRKLAKQNYSHSEIELLGIQKNTENENQTKVHIRFLRFNTIGKMYESAIGIYELIEINETWYITELKIYNDNESAMSSVDLSKMWFPKKENST